MYMYKLVIVFYSYRFLGRQCIGSVEVQAKLKWNARGYCTIPGGSLDERQLNSLSDSNASSQKCSPKCNLLVVSRLGSHSTGEQEVGHNY